MNSQYRQEACRLVKPLLLQGRRRFGPRGLAVLSALGLLAILCLTIALSGLAHWETLSDIISRAARVATGRELDADPALKAREFGRAGVWLGAIFGSAVALLLLALAPWWMPGGRLTIGRPTAAPARPGRLVLLALLLAVGTGCWIRAPRLDHSFWNDEEYSLRRFAHGDWNQARDGTWKFSPVTWADTLFECRNGNNHHLSSVLTRVSQQIWRITTGQPRSAFSETASRLPAFLAGGLTLLLVFALGVEIGWSGVGLAAAWLLALHPWHIRYTVEERGYSLMLMFLCLAMLGLIRALRTNRIRHWLWFALGTAGCLLNFTGALYPVIALNLAAAIELFVRREPRRLGTLLGFNLLAAIPVALWIFPSVPQIMNVLLHDPTRYRPGVGWHWVVDLYTHLVAGIHYHLPEPAAHLGTTWLAQHSASWFYTLYFSGLFGLLLAGGAILAVFHNSATRLAVVAPLVAGAVMVVENSLSNGALLIWYLLYLLIPLALAVPLLVARLFSSRPTLIAPALTVIVAGYALATADKRDRLVHLDRQPMRQVVEGIRKNHPEAMTAVFGVSDRQTQSYDPHVRILKTEADLDRIIADATREQKPLVVYFCGRTESGNRAPELMNRLLNETEFEHTDSHPGLEAMFSYEAWKLRPANERPPDQTKEG